MKHHRISLWFGVPVLLFSVYVAAHDPSEHMKDSSKPDCAAIQDMDHSKIDMNDPLMQAMMQKCMSHTHDDNTQPAQDHTTDDASKNDTKNSEQHTHDHK